MDHSKCVKCGSENAKGFLVDKGHMNLLSKTLWADGLSLLKGPQNKREVTTYRCTSCGYLELFTE